MKQRRRWPWIVCGLGVLVVAAVIGFWLRPMSYLDQQTYLSEKLAGFQSRSVTVQGHRMHYIAIGPTDGSPIVLIHGLGGRAEDWRNLAPYLAAAGFRVYMPDLFGFGRSDLPTDFSYSVSDQATSVVSFMDALGLKQVNLGGWSMGGWIVQLVAARHPERVSRLLIFDSVGLYWKPEFDPKLFMPKTPAELDQLEALLMPYPRQIPAFVAQDVLRISANRAWVTRRAIDTMLTGKDTTDSLLPQLKMPVLLVWGNLDRITPLAEGRKMQQLIPQAKLLTYDCGHLAPGQCAEAMGPDVVSFVRE